MPVTQFTDGVEIEGSQDITQLKVQGHTSQDEPLQTWQDSTEAILAQLTGDGRFQIGSFEDGMMATDDALIEAHRHENATTKPKRGLHLLGEVTGVLDSLVSWVVQELVLKGSGGISALHTALRVRLTNENTGAMDAGADLRAADVEIINNGGSSGNNVPEVTGLRVGVTHQTDGYADMAYGVKVEMQADAPEQVGVQYAFHANAGIAHFGEELEVPVMTSDPDDSAPTDTVKVYVKDDAGAPKLYSKDDQGMVRELGGGGGEVNTASNVGTTGVGLFNQKTGEDLEFKKLNAGSNRVTITDDTENSKVDVDVVEANLSLGNLEGTLGIAKGGTGQTTQAAAFNALSPATTKGDLIVHDGSTSVRLPVGSDGEVLTADSTQAAGVQWAAPTAGDVFPTGSVIMFAGASAPTGWLLCQGQAVSRTTYSALFSEISTTYGVGDGSTTFNLPDLRGRVAVGAGQGGGLSNRNLGDILGEEEHTLTVTEMPSHNHSVTGGSGWANGTRFTMSNNSDYGSKTTGSRGGGEPHNNMQPSLVMNYIIKI